jgi:KUP system potassium uptake protein
VSSAASASAGVDPVPGGGGGTGAKAKAGGAALALGALGVVFGDIGTSPLYALQAVFTADDRAVHATPGEVYGVVSLVFWSVTVIVSVKYGASSCEPTTPARAGSGADRARARGGA